MSNGNPVTDLLQITAGLTSLLDQEADMLQAMKPSNILSLHEEKLTLSVAYESQIKALKDNPSVLQSISAELRTDLKAKMARFQEALAANRQRLRATREATESTLRAIADEVQAKTEKHTGYSANGASGTPGKSGRTSALAFAYDQSL